MLCTLGNFTGNGSDELGFLQCHNKDSCEIDLNSQFLLNCLSNHLSSTHSYYSLGKNPLSLPAEYSSIFIRVSCKTYKVRLEVDGSLVDVDKSKLALAAVMIDVGIMLVFAVGIEM